MSSDQQSPPGSSSAPLSPDATTQLLARVQTGDNAALNLLLERCIPRLRRWARGRLPQGARDMQETADVVQDAVVAAVRHLGRFEIRHQGALQAYFRQCVLNRIRDIIRQQRRRPLRTELPDGLLDERTSPLQKVIGAQNFERYEAALEQVTPADREAIIGRLELEYSYEELAVALGKPSPDAARVAVARAMKRLVEEMRLVNAPEAHRPRGGSHV